MTTYALTSDSYICIDPRYCVLLDARADKYLAISRQIMDRLAPWLYGWPIECHPSDGAAPPPEMALIAADLVKRGILTPSQAHAKAVRPESIPRPSQSILAGLPAVHFAAKLRVARRVFHSRLWAHRRLSHDSLLSIIQSVSARRHSPPSSAPKLDMALTLGLVGAFDTWRGWYSRPNACVFDSLSLLHFLARFDVFPAWVFGVIPEPFQAHCWLQNADVVLNDSIQHVADYTPIMIV